MPSVMPAFQVQYAGANPAPKPTAADTRLHHAAQDFEAMFMTEMLHHARPAPKADGVFATGAGEKAWQVLMDQALGKAAAGHSGAGLGNEIENALKAAQGQHAGRNK